MIIISYDKIDERFVRILYNIYHVICRKIVKVDELCLNIVSLKPFMLILSSPQIVALK